MRKPHPNVLALALHLAILLGLYGGVFFAADDKVLSAPLSDVHTCFAHWRAFGFGELAEGRIALWNPHVYGGIPFLGGFQSALLYPPNLIYLLLPLIDALNVDIVFHLWLFGVGTYWWAGCRGVSVPGRLLAAVIASCGGPLVMIAYRGNLAHLASAAWIPFVLMGVERLLTDPRWRWILLAAGAGCLQLLAGYPQLVYYTGIMALVMALAGVRRLDKRAFGRLGLAVVIGLGLSAVQWIPGIQATEGSIRGGRMPYAFASSHALAPENLLTLVSPTALGDDAGMLYWGRSLLWEGCLFVGGIGLLLAIVGAVRGDPRARRFCVLLWLIALVLAMGKHTPLFGLLYEYIPGFDRLRGVARFVVFAHLMLALLAGAGLDCVRRLEIGRWAATFGLALGLLLAGWAAAGTASPLFGIVGDSGDGAQPPDMYERVPKFRAAAGSYLARSVGLAAATLICGSLLMLLSRKTWIGVWALGLVAILELVGFSWWFREAHPLSTGDPDTQVQAYLESNLGEARMIHPGFWNNRASSRRLGEVWGVGPQISLRWSELFALTQGYDPDLRHEERYIFRRNHELLRLARLKLVLVDRATSGPRLPVVLRTERARIHQAPRPLPRGFLVERWHQETGRDRIFAAMTSRNFDPARDVVLETEPDPRPETGSGSAGTVTVTEVAPGELTISASLARPAILVLTDSYREGWEVRHDGEGRPPQKSYALQPADYAFAALPLAEGEHRLRLRYSPGGFGLGATVSVATLVLLGFGALAARRRRRE